MVFRSKSVLTRLIHTFMVLAFAASASFAAVSVDPVVVETKVKPGRKISGKLTVANTFDQKVEVTVQCENWAGYPRTKDTIPSDSWIKVHPKKFKIGPNKTKKVKYVISMPADAQGELMSMVFFASMNPSGGAINIGTRFGVGLYAAAEGTEKLEGLVERITASEMTKNNNSGFSFFCSVRNSGNVHFRPRGTISIMNQSGEKVNEITAEYGWPLYPGTNHSYEAFWEVEKGKLTQGKYTAEVVFNYGDIYADLGTSFAKSVPFEYTGSEILVNDAQ